MKKILGKVKNAEVGNFFSPSTTKINKEPTNLPLRPFDKYLKEYQQKAEKVYGNLPKHIYETSIVWNNDKTSPASYVECNSNKIVISQLDNDIEWTIFHEMEHIRTAHSINQLKSTGLTSSTKIIKDTIYYEGVSLNEAFTDISVENLLKRKQNKVSYFETIQIIRQLGAILGKDDIELMKYYNKNGRQQLQNEITKLTKDKTLYCTFENNFDNLHLCHTQDLKKEYQLYNQIFNKPLGRLPSKKTVELRKKCENELYAMLDKMRDNNTISAKEYNDRKIQMNKLSPYNPRFVKEFQNDMTK